MNDEFERVIDPLIERLIDYVTRASSYRYSELRSELKDEFRKAHEKLADVPDWKYARYALVAWVDSNLIHIHPKWREKPLEATFYNTGIAYSEFFRKAEQAYRKNYMDAYEVFFICFMFGFRGVYEDITQVPKDLPESEAKWQETAIRRISRRAKEKNKSLENWDRLNDDVSDDRHPLTGYGSMINNLIFFAATALAGIAFYLLASGAK